MSLAIIRTRVHIGIEHQAVTVEVHLANGLPAFNIVGLPEKAVQESRERVRAAITNCQFEFPVRRITVNLAPADLPKEGGGFDLPIAVGILIASGQLASKDIDNFELVGELALSGDIRPVNGILPIALGCSKNEKKLLFPAKNQDQVSLVPGLQAYACNHLLSVAAHLNNTERLPAIEKMIIKHSPDTGAPDMADIRGQPHAKRALVIAAAGKHSLLMVGPPGSGKSMLASRLPGILPALTDSEALETAAIRSINGENISLKQWKTPPFRHPHHSASAAALVGGGSQPKPGEISLAHHGVLFLDELTEFERRTLDVLREPIENGFVSISRVARKTQYPARFQLIAAMNPCPCGYLGDAKRACGTCTAEQIKRYQGKISGPIMDRIDLHIEVPAIAAHLLTEKKKPEQDSTEIRQQIDTVRQLQYHRQAKCNSELDGAELEQHVPVCSQGKQLLEQAIDRLGLSARAYHRVLRVSRTIADLAGSKNIQTTHIAEAISYRKLDRNHA